MPWEGEHLLWLQKGAWGRDPLGRADRGTHREPARVQVLTVQPVMGCLGCLGVFQWMLKAVQFSASSVTCRGGPTLPVLFLPKQRRSCQKVRASHRGCTYTGHKRGCLQMESWQCSQLSLHLSRVTLPELCCPLPTWQCQGSQPSDGPWSLLQLRDQQREIRGSSEVQIKHF